MVVKRFAWLGLILLCCGIAQGQLTPWFESWEEGKDDWTAVVSLGYWSIVDTDATDGAYCMRYTTSNGKAIYRSIGTAEAFELSWDYKGDEVGGGYDLHWVEIRNGLGESRVNFFQRHNQSGPGIELGFWSTVVTATADADTWVHNKLVIKEETCSWYLNNSLIGSVTLGGTAGTDCTEVRLMNGGNNSKAGYIDAIDVSEFLDCGEAGSAYLAGDLTGPDGWPDCYVNLLDFAAFCDDWLTCTDPQGSGCTGWYFD